MRSHLAARLCGVDVGAVARPLLHFLLASQDLVLLELLGLDPGVDDGRIPTFACFRRGRARRGGSARGVTRSPCGITRSLEAR